LNRSIIFDAYASIFGRKCFYRLNRGLYHASLRGMGVLNHKNDNASGERRFLKDCLAELASPTIIDVGANEGAYALSVLAANESARVFAFEPHPRTYQRLSVRSLQRINLIPINAACGSEPGECALYDHRDSSGTGHASLHSGVIETIHHDEADSTIVKVITLDSFFKERGISTVELLKIDTEGHELEVLMGTASALHEGRVKAIQFEFNEMNVVSRVFFKDFRDLLPNFRLFRMVRDGLVPLDPYFPFWCEVFAFQNIVALPER
jgi:FkbM family methyltransferase